jgi:hypothetical protein
MPVYLTVDELVALLDDLRTRVAAGDSFEGSIEYTMPWSVELGDPEDDPSGQPGFRVRAAYRVGNTMGQGGMVMVGEMR